MIDWGVGTACLLQIALGAVSMLVDTKWLFEFEHQANQNHPHPLTLKVVATIDWGVGTACLLQIALGAVSMLVDTKWLFEFEHQANQNHPHPTICTQLGAIGHNAKRDFISIGSLI